MAFKQKIRQIKLVIFSLLALAFLSSCSYCFDNQETLLTVENQKNSNHGLPLYMLVKEVEKAEFLTDDYRGITKEIFSPLKDSAYIFSDVTMPGDFYKVKFPHPDNNKLLGVYFLFTDPGEEWKFMIEPRASRVDVLIGENEIKRIRSH